MEASKSERRGTIPQRRLVKIPVKRYRSLIEDSGKHLSAVISAKGGANENELRELNTYANVII